jgi:hypothetical protein
VCVFFCCGESRESRHEKRGWLDWVRRGSCWSCCCTRGLRGNRKEGGEAYY